MKIKSHIQAKRREIIYALSVQDYTDSEIATIFNLNRSSILRIIAKRPKDYKSPWVKII